MSTIEIEERVRSLGQWFHNIDLNGVQTAPNHFLGDYPNIKWRNFKHAVPDDLSGRTVLDVGCNAGFYSIEMKKRGADRVVGIDSDDVYLNQARFAAEISGFDDIEFRNLSVYDVAELGEKFDLVIFMGVLYHLRHPLLALDILHDTVVKDAMLFQSMQRGSPDVLSVGDAPSPSHDHRLSNVVPGHSASSHTCSCDATAVEAASLFERYAFVSGSPLLIIPSIASLNVSISSSVV